jgi:hypothetical protein
VRKPASSPLYGKVAAGDRGAFRRSEKLAWPIGFAAPSLY